MISGLNRTQVLYLTNKSGGAVVKGDVVIIDSANASAFDVDTSGAYINGAIGVVIEPAGIADNSIGAIAIEGYVPQINLSGAATLGDLFKTHTVAGQAASHAAPFEAGDFGMVLEASATPQAMLWAIPNQVSAAPPVNDYIKVSDTKAANTAGGTFTAGAWQTRVVNTEDSDTGGHCAVGSNQITLAAGTYICYITAPAMSVNRHKAILYNVTDAANVLIGTSEFAYSADVTTTRSIISGKFVLAASKALEVRHYCEATRTGYGFGNEANFGVSEVYTLAEFWKVG